MPNRRAPRQRELRAPCGVKNGIRHSTGYAACGITGDASPSEADMRLTRRLAEGARLLQINLLDHVIVGQPFDGRPGYFSFKEAGTI
jgi:RadC-like JAB domain